MALVRIVGTGRVVDIAKGDERTVKDSEHVQRLVERGGIEILERIEEKPKSRPRRVRPAKLSGIADDYVEAQKAADELVALTEEMGLYGSSGVGGGQHNPVDVAASGPAEGSAVDTPDQTPDR